MRQKIEFDVPGAAMYDNREMQKKVSRITSKEYGVEIDVSGIDFSNYYRSDGAKITKSLASLLRKQLTKEQVQERFSSYAKAVSELYTIGMSLRAELGDKELLGEGKYEPQQTCFRKGAENHVSKKFVVSNKRCHVIVLYQKGKKEAGARCIAYLAGRRNIYLTNFYWRGIPQNRLYMVTAARHLFGLKKAMYRMNPKFFLPIFKNGDSILIYDEKAKPPVPDKTLTCPHCGTGVKENKLYYEEIGSYRLMGCTKECARKHSNVFIECGSCGKATYKGHAKEHNGKLFCSVCYKKLFVSCTHCGAGVLSTDAEHIEGEIICKNCAKRSRCAVCKRVLGQYDGVPVGSLVICKDCLPESGHSCGVCRCVSDKKFPLRRIGMVRTHVCDDCYNPLPGTIMEAQGQRLAEAR